MVTQIVGETFLHTQYHYPKVGRREATKMEEEGDHDGDRDGHVIIVPSPGMGHLIPLTELAKLLHTRHHLSISLLLPTTTAAPTLAQSSYLSALLPAISHTFLPAVDPSLLPPEAAHEVTINLTHIHSAPHVRDSIAALTRSRKRVVAVVTDLFGTGLFDVAREFGIPPYLYFTSTAMCLSFLLHLPSLHQTVSCEYGDMEDPLVLPGCVPLYGKDFVDTVKDRKDEAYKVILTHVKKYKLAEGIFVNTFMDLEPTALRSLQNDYPVYPIGPIIQSGLGDGPGELDCLSWLDQQQPDSVLFVSFGSGGTLSHEQLKELAIGLEKSGQRFLWVVRSPSKSSFGSFFSGKSLDDPFGFLPHGYLDRIAGRGLLIPSWAPQIEVLSHKSTGGFLSHCGWNSTLESIINGVPLIAWPLYAEQRMNAVMLNEGVKVALRPKTTDGSLVEAGKIADVVRELMEGEEGERARQRIKDLSEYGRRATSEDGVSTKLLNQVIQKWQS